ncbi:hypothetical protein B0H14DRAFT_3153753 [Mycena olivaceomarginata]|nr:hypothetical protein B0H14DRAFT_3153753 [Mycena olivaceomarginata]
MAMLRATQRLIALCSPRAAQASGERAGWGAIYPAARHACKGQIETTCGGEMLHRVHGKRVPRSTIAMYLRSAVNGHITVNGGGETSRFISAINQLGSRLGKLPLADNPSSRPSNTTPPPSSPHEDAPETADLYFTYGPGKALLENAISQSSVLGKDRLNDSAEEAHASSSNGPVLSFTCDAEGTEVGLKDIAAEEEAADAGEDDHTADDDAEPEDDLNDPWEVLDLARAIYARQTAQAITDYEAGLKLNDSLLPRSSRQIPEVHYNLSMVLDLMSGLAASATRSPTLRTRSKASSAH